VANVVLAVVRSNVPAVVAGGQTDTLGGRTFRVTLLSSNVCGSPEQTVGRFSTNHVETRWLKEIIPIGVRS
jgi:hypothetical protein